MKVGFEGGPVELIIVVLSFIAVIYWGDKKFKILTTWIEKIKLFPPLWLVFIPAFITYFFVCGTISAFSLWIYVEIVGKVNFNKENFLLLENIVEFTCSLIMPILYFIILKKNNFSIFWSIIITCVHILVAGYRDAKYEIVNPLFHNGHTFESGPRLLKHFEVLDASFPLISLLLFIFFINKRIIPWIDHKIL